MSDVSIKKIGEIPAYEGEYAIEGIQFRYAAKSLGVTAWGMNVLELGPNVEAAQSTIISATDKRRSMSSCAAEASS